MRRAAEALRSFHPWVNEYVSMHAWASDGAHTLRSREAGLQSVELQHEPLLLHRGHVVRVALQHMLRMHFDLWTQRQAAHESVVISD